MENFDNLLPRRHGTKHRLAQRLLLHPRDERLGNTEFHVGFKQRHPNRSHRLLHVGLTDLPLPAQVFKNVL